METIIGFAAGYLVGAKEGRAGFDRLKSSVQAIAKSPEARRMAAEAMSLAGVIVRQTSARGIGTSASEAAELVLRRISPARQP
jgi:uncharacterized protein with PhoU and TrkA domain